MAPLAITIMRKHLWPVLALSLAGCGLQPAKDINSPYYKVPAGSTVVLHRPLQIPADGAAVYIDHGKLSSYWSVNKYQGYCKFEMRSIVDHNRMVQPDTFDVSKVGQAHEYVDSDQPQRVYASVGDGDGGPFVQIDKTIMYLHSAKQPDVFRLTCARWDDFYDPEPMSIRETRQVLGDLISLYLPGESPAAPSTSNGPASPGS